MTKQTQAEKLSIAEISDRFDVDQKQLRAFLRRNHTRDLDSKNARWGDAKNAYRLNVKLTKSLTSYCESRKQRSEAQAS